MGIQAFFTGGLTFRDDNGSSDNLWGLLAALGLKVALTGRGVNSYLSL